MSVMVVFANETHRESEGGRHVGCLVEGTDVGGPVAEEDDRHPSIAAIGVGEARTDGDRNTPADDAVRPQHVQVEVADVHRPALAVAVAGGLTHQLGHHAPQVTPLGHQVPVPAMGGGDLVVRV